jgi:hypothetical protein
MIRISLRGEPRHRTGSLRIHDDLHELATWHRAADGVVIATTANGVPITLTSGQPGHGTLSMAGRLWTLSGITRDGDVIAGEAREVPSDQWMDANFGAGWSG